MEARTTVECSRAQTRKAPKPGVTRRQPRGSCQKEMKMVTGCCSRVAGMTSEAYLEGEAYPGHAAMLPLMCCVATPLQLHPRRWASSPSPAAAAPPHAESSLRVARTRLNPSSRRRRLTHRPACLHRWEERTSGGVVAEERKKEGGRKRKKERKRKKGK
jgi:hypothetical protein